MSQTPRLRALGGRPPRLEGLSRSSVCSARAKAQRLTGWYMNGGKGAALVARVARAALPVRRGVSVPRRPGLEDVRVTVLHGVSCWVTCGSYHTRHQESECSDLRLSMLQGLHNSMRCD